LFEEEDVGPGEQIGVYEKEMGHVIRNTVLVT